MTPKELFDKITKSETGRSNVALGKMMSAPGIQYKKKNYAFFHNDQMCFKLGKEFDIEQYNIKEWSFLSPFKTKPSLTAWYYISEKDTHVWEEFASLAFAIIKKEVDLK